MALDDQEADLLAGLADSGGKSIPQGGHVVSTRGDERQCRRGRGSVQNAHALRRALAHGLELAEVVLEWVVDHRQHAIGNLV